MDRTKICDKQFKELFGSTRTPSPTDPEFMDILQKFIFGEVSTIGTLDNKMRELITITVLSSIQTLPQLKSHIGACLNIGISPIEIREVIYQCAPFIGFPKTLNSISIMNEVFTANGIKLPLESTGTVDEKNRYKLGFAIQNPIYGDEIKQKYKDLPYGDDLSRFLTELGFGDFYTRKGLDVKTRELLVLCILISIDQVGPLKSHILGNLKLGNDLNTICAVIMRCLPYVGIPKAFAAFNTILDIINKKKK